MDIQLFKDKFKTLDSSNNFDEIYSYVDKLLSCVEHNQNIADKENELDFDIIIPSDVEDSTYLLRIVDNLENKAVNYSLIVEKVCQIIKLLRELSDMDNFADKKILKSIILKLEKILTKYQNKNNNETVVSKVKSAIKSVCKSIEEKNKALSEAQENKLTLYRQNIVSVSEKIVDYIKVNSKTVLPTLNNFKPITLKMESQEEGKYKFVTSTAYKTIDIKEINDILTFPLSNISRVEKAEKLTTNDFNNKLKKTLKDESKESKEKYKKAVEDYIKQKYLKQNLIILKSEQPLEQGNSPGKNALIYLDVLADESSKKMHIVDQPGDDISHTKLNKEVIEILRRMGESKQVLFITHKPELVVNLDVDNVIILKEVDSKLNIINGTLEYEDSDNKINILKEVADILDGGEETIRRRWKRYDK